MFMFTEHIISLSFQLSVVHWKQATTPAFCIWWPAQVLSCRLLWQHNTSRRRRSNCPYVDSWFCMFAAALLAFNLFLHMSVNLFAREQQLLVLNILISQHTAQHCMLLNYTINVLYYCMAKVHFCFCNFLELIMQIMENQWNDQWKSIVTFNKIWHVNESNDLSCCFDFTFLAYSSAWCSESSDWANWLGDFLSTLFLRFYKRHKFQTLRANCMWWEIDAHLIFPLLLGTFPKNTKNSIFVVNAISQFLQITRISNFACIYFSLCFHKKYAKFTCVVRYRCPRCRPIIFILLLLDFIARKHPTLACRCHWLSIVKHSGVWIDI